MAHTTTTTTDTLTTADDQRAPAHARRTRRVERRGTIIVLALAVLAVLALLGVSYVSFVQLERDSADAASRTRDFSQQAEVTNRYIASVLTADLFGNKVVDRSVPPISSRGDRIWPKMFEDGEFYDAPNLDYEWFRFSGTGAAGPYTTLDPSAPSVWERVAPQDDAWLAATEPDWDFSSFPSSLDQTTRLHQITNLRSTYMWEAEGSVRNRGEWRRMDGAYVDLAEFFFNERDDRPFAGVNLLELGLQRDETNINNNLGPEAGFRQNIFEYTMAELSEELYSRGGADELNGLDERQWVDTDGDNRPDARWTQVESLGNLGGLVWVVAANIKDASAFANINTAIEFPYALGSLGTGNLRDITPDDEAVGTGLTPADVDLARLLSYDYDNASGLSLYLPDQNEQQYRVNLDRLLGGGDPSTFTTHLEEGVNIDALLADMTADGGLFRQLIGPGEPFNVYSSDPASPLRWRLDGSPAVRNSLTQKQRRLIWEQFTSASPGRASSAFPGGYSHLELVDLRGFAGTNNGLLVSDFEEFIDEGFLPEAGFLGAGEEVGPLRAAADPVVERDAGAANPAPSAAAIFLDTRRQLTTASGLGFVGPVPVTNDAPEFDGQFFREKIRFDEMASLSDAVADRPNFDPFAFNELSQRVFETFIYFLAPQIVDQAARPGVPENGFAGLSVGTPGGQPNVGGQYNAFYGGGLYGPARFWFERLRLQQTTTAGNALNPSWLSELNGEFALLRALSMTANLFDAVDGNDTPTVLRYYDFEDLSLVNQARPEGELSSRLAFGDVHPDAVREEFVGQTDPTGGISVVGLDRAPFLREIVTAAVYQGNPQGTTWATHTINPSDDTEQVGSIIGVELGNPWSEAIDTGGYSLRLQHARDVWIEIDLAGIEIPAGQSAFLWRAFGPTGANPGATDFTPVWDSYVELFRQRIDAEAQLQVQLYPGSDQSVGFDSEGISEPTPPVVFQEMTDAGQSVSALLVRLTPQRLVMDRMSVGVPGASTGFLPGETNSDVGGGFVGGALTVPGANFRDVTDVDGNFIQLGNYRVAVYASMRRPGGVNTSGSGFPQWLVERPQNNIARFGPDARGIAVPDPLPDYTVGVNAQTAVYVEGWDPQTNFTGTSTTPDFTTPDPDSVRLGPVPVTQNLIPDELFDAGGNDENDPVTLGQDAKTAELNVVPAYQLFVPNRPLETNADLLMVSAISGFYQHGDIPGAVQPFIAGDYTFDRAHLPWAIGPGAWFTFAEQLGANENAFADLTGTSDLATNAPNNPYFGLLNPLRYTVTDSPDPAYGYPFSNEFGGTTWDQHVPPAVRLLDGFEALRPDGELMSGRINVNTATDRVLRLLPLIDPIYDVLGSTGSTAVRRDARRVELIKAVRDRYEPRDSFGVFDFSRPDRVFSFTNLLGFRDTPVFATGRPELRNPTVRFRRGFTTPGELMLLATWNESDGTSRINTGSPFNNFAMVDPAFDNAQAGVPPLELWDRYANPTNNPVDDAEERMSMFRALSNIAAARSDVYMVTYVLRGYDPDQIESIDMTAYGDPLDAMTDPLFQPEFETRRLVIFDRSNVRNPTDRPRILLDVALPSTAP